MNDEVTLKEPILYTKKRVAALLNVSERTISRIQEKGLLRPKEKVGNVILFTPDSVQDLFEFFQRKEWYRAGGESDEANE